MNPALCVMCVIQDDSRVVTGLTTVEPVRSGSVEINFLGKTLSNKLA